MASPTPSNLFFSFLISFSLTLAISHVAASRPVLPWREEEDMIHLHFYLHVLLAGQNVTAAPLASVDAGAAGVLTAVVYDSQLTEGPDLSSKLIGRSQGFDVLAFASGNGLITQQNHVFLAGEYEGSTLAEFGKVDGAAAYSERSIVGGSGRFRTARGYSIIKFLVANATYNLLEFNIYVIN